MNKHRKLNKHRKFHTAAGLGAGLLLLGAAWLVQAAITITRADGWICTDGTINVSGAVTPVDASCSDPGSSSFTLTVTKAGGGTGTVTSSPGGINCGTDCGESYASNTQVTLSAAAGGSSTFAGWSGACTGTGSCILNMTANLTATATFNTSGGGGGDPGSGLWINGSNYVHDRGTLTELYVPRCVPTQYNNCRAGGSQSLYDTVVAGQVWAMRIPVGAALGSTTYPFGVERAETGESLNAYDFAVSTVPGDFNVDSKCKKSGTGQVRLHKVGYNPPFGVTSCQVNLNTLYYLNVRPQAGTPAATNCGIGSGNACRYRITLPTGFTYQ
ncbi:MAG: hypothetical protein AB7I68_08795 [Porticoccaceae bacterium]